MSELRVLFDEAGEGSHAVRLYASWSGPTEPVLFAPFLTDQDFRDLRWYLEEFMDLPDGGSLIRARRIEGNLHAWGRQLYDALFAVPANHELLRRLRSQDPPRRLTFATNDARILRLPWELIADENGPLVREITIRRQLETARDPIESPIALPLRILYVVSRPGDAGFIDPRLSSRAVLDALDPLGTDVQVDFCRPSTLTRFDEMLRGARRDGAPYHLAHFDGHGTSMPRTGEGFLCFEKPGHSVALSQTDLVSADRFGTLLSAHRIPVVILEACRTGSIEKSNVFLSVAPRLIAAGIGSVVSMSHAVHVEASRILLERFYRELVAGGSVGQAVDAGRTALMTIRSRSIESGPRPRAVELEDWSLPHLYQRGGDPRLVSLRLTRHSHDERGSRAPFVRIASREPDDTGAFPPAPPYGFQGRALELYELERCFRSHRAVQLHAMGGMGKTTLASEAAHWWTRSGLFPDGACFVSFEQSASVARIIQVLGGYLDGNKFHALPESDQRQRAKDLFDAHDVLVVWDNFESVLPEFQRPDVFSGEREGVLSLLHEWIAAPEGRGRLLITSRPEAIGIRAHAYELRGLARPDSLWLLSRVLQAAGADLSDSHLEREWLDRFLTALDDHPLSIELVGPHLKDVDPECIIADFDLLLQRFRSGQGMQRNESLLASLELSTRRLSATAREALAWLGVFRVGVFEDHLLRVSELDPQDWDAVRAELKATALLRVEQRVLVNQRGYLRFHPTLAYAAGDLSTPRGQLSQHKDVRARFIRAYASTRRTVEDALTSDRQNLALDIVAHEETNLRTAIRWAVEDGEHDTAGRLSDTFLNFLRMSGRLRERAEFAKWFAHAMRDARLNEATSKGEQDEAITLSNEGRHAEAIQRLDNLIDRLRSTTGFDPGYQLARARMMLGRVVMESGQPDRSVAILQDAIRQWEILVDRGEEVQDLLAGSLGYLSAALVEAGRIEEAFQAAERALAIDRELGNERNVVGDMAHCAHILMRQGRFREADAYYERTAVQARRVGDRQVEATILQHRGSLAGELGQYERAAGLLKQAMKLFQAQGDESGTMGTCLALGSLEMDQGRLNEARAWCDRCAEFARRLNNTSAQAAAAHNIGIICQMEGEAAREERRETDAVDHFHTAKRFLGESLSLEREPDGPGAAAALSQIAKVEFFLGELQQALQHADQARRICERLGLPEVLYAYDILAAVEQAKGDRARSSEWQRKRNEVLQELERRAQQR